MSALSNMLSSNVFFALIMKAFKTDTDTHTDINVFDQKPTEHLLNNKLSIP